MMLYQLVSLINRPSNKRRIYFIILLALLILYNVFGWLAPSGIIRENTVLQYNLAYGSGFLFACYIPYYFYRGLELPQMRFHALYGVWIFFFVPYVLFLVIEYSITHDLVTSVQRAVIAPFFYSIVVVVQMFRSISKKFQNRPVFSSEIYLTYFAVVPWAVLPIISYLQLPHHIEIWPTNLGMVVISIVFVSNDIKIEREVDRVLLMQLSVLNTGGIFTASCREYMLTERETEIALLMREGKKYRDIAEILHISPRTVTTHVQNIFSKVKVNSRIDLVRVLERQQTIDYTQ